MKLIFSMSTIKAACGPQAKSFRKHRKSDNPHSGSQEAFDPVSQSLAGGDEAIGHKRVKTPACPWTLHSS